jgi:predicted DNA-binding transcriptional regulator AlpA
LTVSERHVRSLNATGQLPRPIRLGRRKLWNVRELQAWLDAGSPPRDRWEKIRKSTT